MPRLTGKQAVLAAALVACAVYVGALGNGWALDDYGMIERNPAAHSLASAVQAAFSPYWPPDQDFSAGLYRPLVILTYAFDWVISGAEPRWFHLVNIILHGAATALVVALALAWLPPFGALATGLVFTVHPAHVEAVANVVGRAELLAALGMLLSLLTARRYRLAQGARARRTWLAVVLAATAAALLSKEHAVMTIALLALDHALNYRARGAGTSAASPASAATAGSAHGQMGLLYVAVAWLTGAWLFLWNAVAGESLESGAAIGFGSLNTGERLATAIPVQLEVVRLLVWPVRLAADYSPQTIPLRTDWTVVATVAAVTSIALLALAAAARRTAPAVTFGILAAAATYLPTSNLVFLSGVVLAERNLYLGVLAPSLLVGWGLGWAIERGRGFQARVLLAVIVTAGAARAAARVPFWRDSRTVIIQSILDQPENFRAHTRVARALELAGDRGRALAEYAAAGAIFERYAVGPAVAARFALGMGRPHLGLDLARRAHALRPEHAGIVQVLAQAFIATGEVDSAVRVARHLVQQSPVNLTALETYVRVLERTGAPDWQRLLAAARLDWRLGRPVASTARLDSAGSRISWQSPGVDGCWELESSLELMHTLTPTLLSEVERSMGRCR